MTLDEILPDLKSYKAVLVTGPQRSGTTIGGRILAKELGYRYADEDEVRIHSGGRAIAVLGHGKVVLQAPGLCHIADQIANKVDGCVVIMRRPIADILKSEERIHWRTAFDGLNLRVELEKYEPFGVKGDNIAELKYFVWDTYQKPLCASFDLDYESLRGHPLWKDERKEFAPRQWETA